MHDLLLKGKNVILSVPTGAGKTWASIIPFLYARDKQLTDFPSKMIYSLPLRTLTNSIYEDVRKICPVSIQTGEYGEDPYFENDIIFSTIDQTLSNFLCFPLALSPRQANINAGSLIGSYLVFDEFHLLDTKLSMATTIGMLKMLNNLCRCCIMTATLSEDFMKALKDSLTSYEIITLYDFPEDIEKIASLLPKENKKKVEVIGHTISSQMVIKEHKSKTVIICNRVESAQKIYNDILDARILGELEQIKEENIICLHSRYFDNDRKQKENKLKELFGKQSGQTEQAILVATQVIEAGMDISCDVLHTEISPISSFLQRAGRCARFERERGEIFVYDLLELDEHELIKIDPSNAKDKAEIKRLNNKYLPYDKIICIVTLEHLKNVQTLDDPIPCKLIESILGDDEKIFIEKMYQGQGGGFNQDKIRESWASCQKNQYRSTIRDIQSVEITLITDAMCPEVAKHPYLYQSVGVFKWSLVGWSNKIIKGEGPISFDEEDWLIKMLEENNILGEFENDEEVSSKLRKVTDFQMLPSQVYLNAKYFGYNELFGFNWQYHSSFGYVSPKREGKIENEDFKALTKDTFYQHNIGLIGAFKQNFLKLEDGSERKLDFVFNELSRYLEMPSFGTMDFIELISTMIIFHDYGKLNTSWQQPMQHYQSVKENIKCGNYIEILAHTDYDSRDEADVRLGKEVNLNKRPAHAGVGAYVAHEILIDLDICEYLKSAVSVAIARHHSPVADSYPDFDINERNYSAIQVLLDEFQIDIELKRNGIQGRIDAFETDWHGEYLAYLFLVRILRLCDQKATKNLSYYIHTTHNG